MFLRLLSIILASSTFLASYAPASVVSYTLTGGKISGALDTTFFNDVNFTITAQADPTAFVPGTIGGHPVLFSQPINATMTIDGFSPFILESGFRVIIVDYGSESPGAFYGAFAKPNQFGAEGFGTFGSAVGDLVYGPGSVTGAFEATEPATYSTSAGTLWISSFTDNGSTFTASGAAVPEPTSMAIFGLGALGLAYRARRKIKA